MTKQITGKAEAEKKIQELLDEISALYSEIQSLSMDYDIFISYHGPVGYGDGGYCDGGEWQASSQGC